MSLLSARGATHAVTVILRRIEVDERHARRPVEVGRVVVRGRLQPAGTSDADRLQGTGVAVIDTQKFICADFPGDDISQVEYGGVTYEVVGAPRRHRSSRNTRRDTVMLTAKNQLRKVGP